MIQPAAKKRAVLILYLLIDNKDGDNVADTLMTPVYVESIFEIHVLNIIILLLA